MDRLAFFPVTIVTVLVAIQLNLTNTGLAILTGIVVAVAAIVRDRDTLNSSTLAWMLLAVGLVALILSYFICQHYGITLDALDQDKSFPKLIRRLPHTGIAFLTSGVTLFGVRSVIRTPKHFL